MELTKRERILLALEHKEPDRVPVDLGGMPSTGIMGIAYNRLKNYWGIRGGKTRIYDLGQQLALVEREILERIEADVLPLFIKEPQKWKPWKLPDGSSCEIPEEVNLERLPDGSTILRDEKGETISKMPPQGYYFDGIRPPLLTNVSSLSELRKFEFHTSLSKEELRALNQRARKLYKNTDYVLMLNGAGGIYERAQNLRGWDRFMMDLVSDPKFAGYLLDKLVEANIRQLEEILPQVEGWVQIIQVGDDLGMQTGPQLSLKLYRKIVKPRHKKLYEYIKTHSKAYLFLHSCGAIFDFIPDFIEMGVDILNPVQISAQGMDSKKLKKEFGKEIVFWGGGCDTQKVLPFGTPKDVEEEVKRRIEDFAPGGGFVFCQVHNIQAKVPPENIEAMYEAVKKFGRY